MIESGDTESSQRAVVPASPVEVQSQPAFQSLPGEFEAGRGAAGGIAVLAPGFVAHFGGLGSGAVGADRGAAEMVAEQLDEDRIRGSKAIIVWQPTWHLMHIHLHDSFDL